MNKSFITVLISKKYKISREDSEQFSIKLLLNIPSFSKPFVLYDLIAYAHGNIAHSIAELCIEGEYLFIEGYIWIQPYIINIKDNSSILSPIFIITDMQAIF